ncbi:MAG TPA: GntR family transcriptional regulator [Candidatus Sulfotelmatobacter sp.]|nr:GntR family transcriptional regulator [Candidatus Sulfotelmatobacter sp.]
MPVARRTTDIESQPAGASAERILESLTERAYRLIEELIVTLRIAPGSVVSEASLSARLGIGRTPIREALQRLARERLVVVLPRRGIMVSEINVRTQLRLLEVRRELERLIARSAARRAGDAQRQRFRAIAGAMAETARSNDDIAFMRSDRELNLLELEAARNEFATGAMTLMHGLSRRFWYIHYKEVADLPLAARLHANLALAIADGDADAAAAASDRLLDYIEAFTRATVTADA